MNQIAKMIEREVLYWSGVTEETHRFGDIEFRVNNHVGHLHGDYLAFLPFPVRGQELVAQGRGAVPHHIYSKSGWVSYYTFILLCFARITSA